MTCKNSRFYPGLIGEENFPGLTVYKTYDLRHDFINGLFQAQSPYGGLTSAAAL
jgi:hypothetical protein